MGFASIIILSVVAIAAINTFYSTKYKIVNMPSAPQTRHAIIEDIQATKGDCNGLVIYDCGSGWGGLCQKLSNAFPFAHVTGIEISPIPFLVSYLSPWRKYTVQRGNLFETDLSHVDILVFYLSPYHAHHLAQSLHIKLKKGAVIYSQGFPLDGWETSLKISVPFTIEKNLYRYSVDDNQQNL